MKKKKNEIVVFKMTTTMFLPSMKQKNKFAKGKIERYKVRLVTKGYRQQHDTDYNEAFAPITHLETIRLIIFSVIQNNQKIFQMEVKSTFLNDYL